MDTVREVADLAANVAGAASADSASDVDFASLIEDSISVAE